MYLVEIGANEVLFFIRFGQSWPVFGLLTLLAQDEDHPTIRRMILRCLLKLAPHATIKPLPPEPT
jgi:hypothetical protein